MSQYVFGCGVQFDEAVLDRIFQNCFGYKTDGVFVEVGAYDGISFSHTYGLANLGWRGVYIEPMPVLAAKCRSNHSNNKAIKTLECAAGSHNGSAAMWKDVTGEIYCGCSFNSEIAKDKLEIHVQVRTLDSILETESILPGFDLLSIDVEFGEVEVMKGFTLDKWMPKMAIIELCEKHTGPQRQWAKPALEYCDQIFHLNHYCKIYSDNINTIFSRL